MDDTTRNTDRLVSEGDGGDNPFDTGDEVAYAGHWNFTGTVTSVDKRTVRVRSDDGRIESFDWRDLRPVE